jgi:hypothetical protein
MFFIVLRHIVNHMDYDPGRQLLLTVGQDSVMRLWRIAPLLEAATHQGP